MASHIVSKVASKFSLVMFMAEAVWSDHDRTGDPTNPQIRGATLMRRASGRYHELSPNSAARFMPAPSSA